MVYRIYVEKKQGLDSEAQGLCSELREFLGIGSLRRVRVFNRYDVGNISGELFRYAVERVFSEPQLDDTYDMPDTGDACVFATEYLPGQFDQRADSAAQCIQIISMGERPAVKSAKVYALYGDISAEDVEKIKRYVINPVEAREASFDIPETLEAEYPHPGAVKTLSGFRELDDRSADAFANEYGLAMDRDDLLFCRDMFRQEGRDPTVTELRVIDTYWSDHCRHTTFNTVIDSARFGSDAERETFERYLEDKKKLGREKKPVCLMDIATQGTRLLRAEGKLPNLDESEEINACTVKFTLDMKDGEGSGEKKEPWLLLFKNETHNHPTEIEPFGGAATCIGGAIRDPLSGRAYVYGAMRVTGAADPTVPVSETLPGKLPQRKIVTGAAAGYSSYGNQIGLATGTVDEVYHPGYAAKRMEIGAVIAAAPASSVRRERPAPGDVVILIGGATGRDGIGGATGSSKAHDKKSVETCGAEVQKGNAPEERKLQRLFRNPAASRLIKRCNDFGAGGVSVAVGELAPGLSVDLDAVPRKYEGLDGTELAISESQERMAAVVAAEDADAFLALAAAENLQATVIAKVTEEPRLVMHWNGQKVVDISRAFLDTAGAEKHISVQTEPPRDPGELPPESFAGGMKKLCGSLNFCSKRGLAERFDSTIGAGTVVMPFGGERQRSPSGAMVQKVSLEDGSTDCCSLMSWGFDPAVSEKSPFRGAYLAVVESVSKLIASGADTKEIYLTLQEYFEKPGTDPKRWGKPLSAVLGALRAQKDFGFAAIGGKDSMSGSFEDLDVPPTLVSFAVTLSKTSDIVTGDIKEPGDSLFVIDPEYRDGLPVPDSQMKVWNTLSELSRRGAVRAAYTPGYGGAAGAVYRMICGGGYGFEFDGSQSLPELFSRRCGSMIAEAAPGTEDMFAAAGFRRLGRVTCGGQMSFRGETVGREVLDEIYEDRLESVYPMKTRGAAKTACETFTYCFEGKRPAPAVKTARPRVLIPVFPGTNCEYDSAAAVRRAGMDAEVFIIRNLTPAAISESAKGFAGAVKNAQAIFVPGGFSGGDEPDGSGKFITAFFRNPDIATAVEDLLDRRDGLVCGICNGFQALIKLGLLPYGRITDTGPDSPTLTFNTIGRHQSKIVRTRIASNMSPWLSKVVPGDVISVPISHGEGRFLASAECVAELARRGQIATQYCDISGNVSDDIEVNPNGSAFSVEGITSPDGRVFGKMGHSERTGAGLYLNVPGRYDIGMFESAAEYFRG